LAKSIEQPQTEGGSSNECPISIYQVRITKAYWLKESIVMQGHRVYEIHSVISSHYDKEE